LKGWSFATNAEVNYSTYIFKYLLTNDLFKVIIETRIKTFENV
jgi:hypothetical protein